MLTIIAPTINTGKTKSFSPGENQTLEENKSYTYYKNYNGQETKCRKYR